MLPDVDPVVVAVVVPVVVALVVPVVVAVVVPAVVVPVVVAFTGRGSGVPAGRTLWAMML